MSNAVLNGLAGAGGGIIAQIITYPLQTVNTRQQTERSAKTKTKSDQSSSSRNRGTSGSTLVQLIQLFQSEGLGGLYSGLKPSLFGTAASQGVYYYFYQLFKNKAEARAIVRKNEGRGDGTVGMFSWLVVAAMAGSLNVLCTNPIWVLVTRMQTHTQAEKKIMEARMDNATREISTANISESEKKAKLAELALQKPRPYGTFLAASEVYNEAGIRGFWKGIIPTLVMVCNPSIQFMVYETSIKHLRSKRSSIKNEPNDKKLSAWEYVIVVDDEDRENEGDLIMAASLVTPEAMAFIVRHGTGIVCVSMKEEDLVRLQLPQMVTAKENEEKLCTAFTVSVDAKEGTTTGVSAKDRAKTILALASPNSRPQDFNRPGHIFPLKYREGGVLKRAGHTEASVDLAMLAGLPPVAVLCEIVDDDDGSMARLPKLREFAKQENLKIISIADLIRYRRKRDRLVERSSVASLPLRWGSFQAYCYRSLLDGMEHIAMVKGDIGDGQDILVRVHSECLTGDIFGSARCDCGNQLALAMEIIEKAGRGIVVYLRGHEGRGIGLGHKLRAYNLQDAGIDTVEANEELGLPVDSREYGIGAQILRDLGVRTMKLITNNPAKYVGLKGYGLSVAERVPLLTPITKENKRYLDTKRAKMGHVYGSEFNGRLNGSGQSASSEKEQ